MSWKTKKRCKSLKYLCCSKELTGQESFHDWSSCDNYWSTNEETFQQILANLRTLTWWESVSALLIYVSSAIWANVRTFATISGFIFLHSDLFSSGKSGLAYNICPQSTKGLWLELEIVQMFRPPWGHFDEDEDWHRQCWVLDSGRVALEMFQMSVLPHLRNIQLWPCQYEIAQLRRKIWEKLYFAEKYDEKSYFWSGCGGASDTGHWLPKFQILSINQTGLPENLSLRQNVSLDLRLVATIAELNLGPNITFPRYHSSISNIVSLDHLTMGELLWQLNIIDRL